LATQKGKSGVCPILSRGDGPSAADQRPCRTARVVWEPLRDDLLYRVQQGREQIAWPIDLVYEGLRVGLKRRPRDDATFHQPTAHERAQLTARPRSPSRLPWMRKRYRGRHASLQTPPRAGGGCVRACDQ